jgi:hypothetical protein
VCPRYLCPRPVWLLLALALATAGVAAGSATPARAVEAQTVVMQGLDKITARTRRFEIPVGASRSFGSLEITARVCHKTPPEEPPEQKAFLQIVDVRPDRQAVTVFSGWMFGSSPALNALEHPVYDVWVVDCRVR